MQDMTVCTMLCAHNWRWATFTFATPQRLLLPHTIQVPGAPFIFTGTVLALTGFVWFHMCGEYRSAVKESTCNSPYPHVQQHTLHCSLQLLVLLRLCHPEGQQCVVAGLGGCVHRLGLRPPGRVLGCQLSGLLCCLVPDELALSLCSSPARVVDKEEGGRKGLAQPKTGLYGSNVCVVQLSVSAAKKQCTASMRLLPLPQALLQRQQLPAGAMFTETCK